MAKADKPSKPKTKAKAAGKQPPPKPPPDQLADLEAAAGALARQTAGEKLSVRQRAALRRVTKLFAAAAIADAYRSFPKKLWVKWSGRQHKQIDEQADRHGLPLSGATIDLEQLAPALHELLAKRENAAGKRKRADRSLDLIRREELLIKRLERLAKQGVMIERQSVHDTFQLVAEILRKSGAAILDQFGNDAHALLDEALEEAMRLVRSLSADGTDVDN